MPIAQVAPIPPTELYAIVLKFGYRLLGETRYNWIISRDGEDEPLVLPKLGRLVSLTIMNKFFEHSGMDLGTYFALKAMISGGTGTVH